MPTHELNDELYHLYDAAIAKTLENLMQKSPKCNNIYLRGFDRKNKEHLFILRVAFMLRDLTQISIEIDCKRLDVFIINWKIRKHFDKVKRMNPYNPGGFYTPQLINKIKAEMKNTYGAHIYLDEVYDAYYEGSLN